MKKFLEDVPQVVTSQALRNAIGFVLCLAAGVVAAITLGIEYIWIPLLIALFMLVSAILIIRQWKEEKLLIVKAKCVDEAESGSVPLLNRKVRDYSFTMTDDGVERQFELVGQRRGSFNEGNEYDLLFRNDGEELSSTNYVTSRKYPAVTTVDASDEDGAMAEDATQE